MNIDPELDERELGFRGLQGHLHVEPRVYENFEWFISGICRRDGQLELQCQFNSDLFDRQTIEQHLEGLETFLSAMAAEPTSKLFQLPVMSIRQRQQLLVDWNATDNDYPRAATVHQEIRDQAERTPDRVAVCFDRQPLTYQQLQVMANQLAHYLVQAGVRRGDRVGICMPRSTEMLASALAIWQTGAAYVPLDPVYPSDRLQMMIEDAGLKQILAMTDIHTKIGQTSAQVINLQAVRQQLATLPQTFVETASDPADVAYVIYTSGSTGKPKGVQVPHGCVVNFLHSMRREPGFGADDRVLAITTMSFDISVLELYLPLICGGQVVIADQRSVVDGKQLMQLLDRHQVNVLQATPSTWRMLVEAGWSGNKRLKALCGGEAFPRDLVKQLHARCGEVWNMYGPTETTVWSTAYRIEDPDGPLYIGKPIANTQLYVLDAKFQPVPVGAVGELYIGGAGVTHGYLNRPELNEARFVDHPYFNPFQDYLNHRLYQTGDLVRYRPDGNVEYLQRNDKQVKLRGIASSWVRSSIASVRVLR